MQRLEIARRSLAYGHRRLIARQQFGGALMDDRLHRSALERQTVDRSGGLHAGDRAEARERGVEEPADL